MIKTKNLKKILVFTLIFFTADLALTQWFLKNFYYKNLERQRSSDIKNRVYNKNYMYTFAKKKTPTGSKQKAFTHRVGVPEHFEDYDGKGNIFT